MDPIDDLTNIVEDALEFDLDQINVDSESEAKDVLRIVSNIYHDEKFLEAHPQIKARIDLELDTLRGLIKMRKADEEAHDAILISIQTHRDNASMYRALTEIQKTSIAVSNKIHDTIDRLNQICKGIPEAMDYNEQEPDDDSDEDEQENDKNIKPTHRGSKSFIQEVLKKT